MSALVNTRRWFGRFAVLACIFVLPFLRFLLYNEYGLLRLEVAVATAVLVLLCGLLALLCRPRPAFIAVTLVSFLLMSANTVSELLAPAVHLRLRWILSALACAFLAGLFSMRENFFRLVLVFSLGAFSVDLAQAVVASGSPASASPAASSRSFPHIIFLIFDEHIGLGGLPDEIEECRQARTHLAKVLSRHGFEIYPNAFSNYRNSMDSIASLLNGKLVDSTQQMLRDAPGENVLRTNRLFSDFRAKGYRLAVYQSDYIDFCPPAFDCETTSYDANTIREIDRLPLRWTDKFSHIGVSYLHSDPFVRDMAQKVIPFARNLRARRIGPLSVSEVWPEPLVRDIRAANKETVFFAHLLTPHYPYIYARDGSVRDYSEWGVEIDLETSDAAQYRRNYRRYAGQAQYLSTQIDRFLEALEKSPSYDSSLIVLCGDHGSRLRLIDDSNRAAARLRVETAKTAMRDRYDYTGTPELRDLMDRFSALFAVKPPAAKQARMIPRKASILRLSAESLDPAVAAALPEAADEVYLFDAAGKPLGIPILKIWHDKARGPI